jgi:hypothetical protein
VHKQKEETDWAYHKKMCMKKKEKTKSENAKKKVWTWRPTKVPNSAWRGHGF